MRSADLGKSLKGLGYKKVLAAEYQGLLVTIGCEVDYLAFVSTLRRAKSAICDSQLGLAFAQQLWLQAAFLAPRVFRSLQQRWR